MRLQGQGFGRAMEGLEGETVFGGRGGVPDASDGRRGQAPLTMVLQFESLD
jgi:hypothetical protein